LSVVLITGAAQGLGREVARRLAAAGDTVFVSARDPEKARRAAAELEGDVRALPVGLDVTDDASVRDAAATLDRLDVLVNNAAAYVNWNELPSGADLSAAHAALETNLFGAWRTSIAFLPLLRASEHPRIVNVSSGAARDAVPQALAHARGADRARDRGRHGRAARRPPRLSLRGGVRARVHARDRRPARRRQAGRGGVTAHG
jgi:NAD(P)-dependent dehydrogenase (short-subunit alcohol dehydrogenase family)